MKSKEKRLSFYQKLGERIINLKIIMKLSNFFKLADLTNKEIALIDYFRIDDINDKYNGNFSLLVNAKDGYDTFSYEEIEELMTSSDSKEVVNRWRNIIAFILNVDLTAQKYFYQMISAIYRPNNIDRLIKLDAVRACYFNFLKNTFSALVLNHLFKGLIDIKSLELLTGISIIEKEPKDYCLLLKQNYLRDKNIIVATAKSIIQEMVEYVKDDEYLSPNFISSAIDDVVDTFARSLRLLDFKGHSDTIGLNR